MSLTSYRAAPSRATKFRAPCGSPEALLFPASLRETAAGCSIPRHQFRAPCGRSKGKQHCKWVQGTLLTNSLKGTLPCPPASKPGDDLLFHRLSDSTIGAVRFHGRVRDGIGWGTDAMATKLWGRRTRCSRNRADYQLFDSGRTCPILSLMVGFIKRE